MRRRLRRNVRLITALGIPLGVSVATIRITCGRVVCARKRSTRIRARHPPVGPGCGWRAHGAVADVVSPAAYDGLVGGTMVLAGCAWGRRPGPVVRTDRGCDLCGHFAVSGALVGDHPGGPDAGRDDQGRTGRRRHPLRLLPRLDGHGRRHPTLPQLDSGHDQLDPVLVTARTHSVRRRTVSRRTVGRQKTSGPVSRNSSKPGRRPLERATGIEPA